LFIMLDCNFKNSGGLGILSFLPHDAEIRISLLTLSGCVIVSCWAIYVPSECPRTFAFLYFQSIKQTSSIIGKLLDSVWFGTSCCISNPTSIKYYYCVI
jgi:hypothetical protein